MRTKNNEMKASTDECLKCRLVLIIVNSSSNPWMFATEPKKKEIILLESSFRIVTRWRTASVSVNDSQFVQWLWLFLLVDFGRQCNKLFFLKKKSLIFITNLWYFIHLVENKEYTVYSVHYYHNQINDARKGISIDSIAFFPPTNWWAMWDCRYLLTKIYSQTKTWQT